MVRKKVPTVYTLHIGNKNYSSWSLRPWVLMAQLGIVFEEVMHPFGEGSNRETFRAFSPSGLVPCLMDGGAEIWDSLAIVEYLHEKHGGVWPEADDARTWARCVTAEMHSGFVPLREECPMNCGVRFRLNAISPSLARDIARIDELWCQGLQRFGGGFLAGPAFTAADAFFVPVAFRLRTYGLEVSDTAQKYADLLLSLESVKEWEMQALKEPWKEHAQEDGMRQSGVVLEDYRKNHFCPT